jgi:hypothetical protein
LERNSERINAKSFTRFRGNNWNRRVAIFIEFTSKKKTFLLKSQKKKFFYLLILIFLLIKKNDFVIKAYLKKRKFCATCKDNINSCYLNLKESTEGGEEDEEEEEEDEE